jgi:hypothetical protein
VFWVHSLQILSQYPKVDDWGIVWLLLLKRLSSTCGIVEGLSDLKVFLFLEHLLPFVQLWRFFVCELALYMTCRFLLLGLLVSVLSISMPCVLVSLHLLLTAPEF